MIPISIPIRIVKILGRLSVYDKIAARISVKSADNIEQRGFAAAGRTENRNKFTFSKPDINSAQRCDSHIPRGVFFIYIFENQHTGNRPS